MSIKEKIRKIGEVPQLISIPSDSGISRSRTYGFWEWGSSRHQQFEDFISPMRFDELVAMVQIVQVATGNRLIELVRNRRSVAVLPEIRNTKERGLLVGTVSLEHGIIFHLRDRIDYPTSEVRKELRATPFYPVIFEFHEDNYWRGRWGEPSTLEEARLNWETRVAFHFGLRSLATKPKIIQWRLGTRSLTWSNI